MWMCRVPTGMYRLTKVVSMIVSSLFSYFFQFSVYIFISLFLSGDAHNN